MFSTDVTLKFVETKTLYNAVTKEGYAIAYIDRAAAIRYWSNELNVILGSIEASQNVAQAYIDTGFKDKAKIELKKADAKFSAIDQPLFWIAFLGGTAMELDSFLSRRNTLEHSVKTSLSALDYGTAICIRCSADMFGTPNVKLLNEIKGILSLKGCNFVEVESAADWVVTVSASAREHNKADYGSSSAYFSYVDAVVSLTKVATAQVICTDEITEKGSHTKSYMEAARNAYQQVGQKIASVLREYIK